MSDPTPKDCPPPLRIGDRVPMPERKLQMRPAWTGSGSSSFKPARNGKRGS